MVAWSALFVWSQNHLQRITREAESLEATYRLYTASFVRFYREIFFVVIQKKALVHASDIIAFKHTFQA